MVSQTNQYWRTLLAEYNKVPFGEPPILPRRHSNVAASWSLSHFRVETFRPLVIAAWAIVLSKHIGVSDILVGEGTLGTLFRV